MSATLALTKELISRPSVTPDDKGCQDLMATRLSAIGFEIEYINFGEVTNLWARYGSVEPLFVFAGHTDVVPTGPLDEWASPPFSPEIRDGYLYGRGAADMKGSLAAMVTACERFFSNHKETPGSVAFLITSDEEGPSVDGTVKVVKALKDRGTHIDYCLVGEPSSTDHVGDIVKNGRRGSFNGVLTILGTQGHVAYPHLANNPIHLAAPAITELCAQEWDQGNEFFPPTTFQVSNISSGTGANNVIPGEIDITFNFRYSTETHHEELRERVTTILDKHPINYKIDWSLSGKPFLTSSGKIIDAVKAAIKNTTGQDTELSTAGGTSDGRFIAPNGTQVVELGPVNATIHKINECVKASDLDLLSTLYEQCLVELFDLKA